MRSLILGSALVLFIGAGAFACSDDPVKTGSNTDAGTDSGGGTRDGGSDAPSAVNDCTTFVDKTVAADARDIPWDFPISTDPLRCMKIKVGQTVAWNGDFTFHPLGVLGGDTPNPISAPAAGDAGTQKTVIFTSAGTFGFVCLNHSTMKGAIQVVP